MSFPAKYARRILGLSGEHQAKAILTKAAHEFLNELVNFPEKINPEWLKVSKAIGDGGQPLHPSSGLDIKAEQEKAKARRKAENADHAESASQGQGEDRLIPCGARTRMFITPAFARFCRHVVPTSQEWIWPIITAGVPFVIIPLYFPFHPDRGLYSVLLSN